jgi:hypothetical protein
MNRHHNVGVNNPMYGKKHSEETKKKLSLSHVGKTIGNQNGNWRDDKVKNSGLHEYIRRYLPKTEKCQMCNKRTPYDLANINPIYNPETYNRDLNNWHWLCRACHLQSDGRIKNLELGKRFEKRQ